MTTKSEDPAVNEDEPDGPDCNRTPSAATIELFPATASSFTLPAVAASCIPAAPSAVTEIIPDWDTMEVSCADWTEKLAPLVMVTSAAAWTIMSPPVAMAIPPVPSIVVFWPDAKVKSKPALMDMCPAEELRFIGPPAVMLTPLLAPSERMDTPPALEEMPMAPAALTSSVDVSALMLIEPNRALTTTLSVSD